jgi:carboxyl-terminal processing protease
MHFQMPIWLVSPLLGLMLALGLGGGYFAATQRSTPIVRALSLMVSRGQGYFTAAQGSGTCPQSAAICARFNNFWKAWDLAADQYVDPAAVDPNKMIDGAISGMIESLGDTDHTEYLSAEQALAHREALAGAYVGIGARIDVKNRQPLVVEPFAGSPAEQAGLRPGDLILKVNGEDVRGFSKDQLAQLIRGPEGTQVTLTILHADALAPIELTITRAVFTIASVNWQMLPNQVALIQLTQFGERTSDEFKQALADARVKSATAIVLDLRGNSGGYLEELIGVASQLLPPETTVLIEQDRDGRRAPLKTRAAGVVNDLPMVVLIDYSSISAGEILAGALKDAGRARVIGQPTFGTATVLEEFDLNDGAQVLIGTSQWLTPKGEVVRGKGIQPDELIILSPNTAPLSPQDAAALDQQALLNGSDIQLARALQVLKENKELE